MGLQNARWSVGNRVVSSFAQGRRVQTAVEIDNFGGDLEFALRKVDGPNSQEIFSQTARQAAVGASSVDASLGLDMNFLWERLLMSEEFSLIRASLGPPDERSPQPTNAPFLAEQITDRTFWAKNSTHRRCT